MFDGYECRPGVAFPLKGPGVLCRVGVLIGLLGGFALPAVLPAQAFANLAFKRFSLQPMDGPELADNTARAIAYCLAHPQWRLSLQTHKAIGIR